MGIRILTLGEDGLNADGPSRFVDGEVGGVGKTVEQGEANVVISDSAGEGIFLNAGKLILEVEEESSTESFAASVVVIDGFLNLLMRFGSDLQFIAFHQSSLNLVLAVSQSTSSSGCLV